MADPTTVLLAKYNEHRIQARQHETLRATATNFIVAVAGGVFVFSGGKASESTSQIVAGLFLVIVGLVGACMSAKHYERFRYHSSLATAYDEKLRGQVPESNLEGFATIQESHEKKFPIFSRVRAYFLWTTLLLSISLLGIVVVVLATQRYCGDHPTRPWFTNQVCK